MYVICSLSGSPLDVWHETFWVGQFDLPFNFHSTHQSHWTQGEQESTSDCTVGIYVLPIFFHGRNCSQRIHGTDSRVDGHGVVISYSSDDLKRLCYAMVWYAFFEGYRWIGNRMSYTTHLATRILPSTCYHQHNENLFFRRMTNCSPNPNCSQLLGDSGDSFKKLTWM